MTIDLATLRALATSCDHYHGSALLLSCDEIAALRATLARMATPIYDLTAAAHRALRPFGARHWNNLAPDERDAFVGYHRACLDYLAGGDGNGTIYSAGPGDPPPTAPPT